MTQKKISNPYLLTLTCIYETVRQTGIGPSFFEIHDLLRQVYCVNIEMERLVKILKALEKNHITFDNKNHTYYPVIGGVFLFASIKDKLIPPQTVAQQRR